MTDKKLTWAQKDARREARKHGETAASAVGYMKAAMREVMLWSHVETCEQGTFWNARAEMYANKAVEYTVKAAHEAAKSLR